MRRGYAHLRLAGSTRQREVCVGKLRYCITSHVYKVLPYHDHIHGPYYYRCPSCGTFSALNLYFNSESYTTVPIEAYSIPDIKWILNRVRVEWIRSRVDVGFPHNPVVYDLGSGEGCFTSCLLQALPHSRVVSVESDIRMKEQFKAEYIGAEFVTDHIEAFLERAALRPEADLIILTDVLEHVLDPPTLLDLIAGALKHTGFAYITVPNADSFHCFEDFPHHVPVSEIDAELTRITSQHLWMINPAFLNHLINRKFSLREMSRSFETGIRRDSDYSTFLVQRRVPPLS